MNRYSKKAIWAFILTVFPIAAFFGTPSLMSFAPNTFLSVSYLVMACLFPILSIIGLVLGIVSLKNMKESKELKGKGLAIVAIILGVIILVITFFGAIGMIQLIQWIVSPSRA